MTGLGYYDPWYHRAPEIHKAVGVLVGIAMLARLAWRIAVGVPKAEPGIPGWEKAAAHLAHGVLYLGVFAAFATGYLMSTAKGDPVSVFGLFELQPTVTGLDGQADTSGLVHLWIGYGLIGLAAVHALAALKHHFFDRDATLVRMFGVDRGTPATQSSHGGKE